MVQHSVPNLVNNQMLVAIVSAFSALVVVVYRKELFNIQLMACGADNWVACQL